MHRSFLRLVQGMSLNLRLLCFSLSFAICHWKSSESHTEVSSEANSHLKSGFRSQTQWKPADIVTGSTSPEMSW